MRTHGLKSVLVLLAAPMAIFVGCGDDTSTTGGGGAGGAGTGGATTSTTSTSTTSTSTTSTTTTTSTGGGAPGFESTCPGSVVTLAQDESVTISGSTAGASSDFESFCADPAGTTPDVVLTLEFPKECTLSINLTDKNAFDGAFELRPDVCASRGGGTECINQSTNNESLKKAVPAGTYYLVVDGANGTSGDFDASITCAMPACGDGVVNDGEECDTGPGVTPNDGCGDATAVNACNVESTVAGTDCATVGPTLSIPMGSTTIPGMAPLYDNTNAGDDFTVAASTCLFAAGGNDNVFAFQPAASGTLTIRRQGLLSGAQPCVDYTEPECNDLGIYVREASCMNGTQVACAETDVNTGFTTLTMQADATKTYYLVVDGYNSGDFSYGPYSLKFTLAP